MTEQNERYYTVGYSRHTLSNVPESVVKPLEKDGILEWCHLCNEYHPVHADDGQVVQNWETAKTAIEKWKAEQTAAIRGMSEQLRAK